MSSVVPSTGAGTPSTYSLNLVVARTGSPGGPPGTTGGASGTGGSRRMSDCMPGVVSRAVRRLSVQCGGEGTNHEINENSTWHQEPQQNNNKDR